MSEEIPNQENGGGPPPSRRPAKEPILAVFRAATRVPPRRVDHTYRDYSNFLLSDLPLDKKVPSNFPSKLHRILSNPAFSHIISWMPHGRAWKIHNKELLVWEVITKYFAHTKYESFTRQLNGWGFKRLHQAGNDYNAYYHECFLRGMPHLTALLTRMPPHQGKLIPYVEGEPNFYEIDKQFPLPAAPEMPYQGHCPHPPGQGIPSEPPASYHYPEQYAPHPSSYPPPPAQYYSGHPGPIGHGDDGAAAAYSSHPGYPPHPYYSTQYTQPPERYRPHADPSRPPYGAPPYFYSPPSTTEAGPVNSQEFPWDAGVSQEGTAPVGEEGRGDCLEPMGAFGEAETAATDVEHDSQEGWK